MAQQQISKRHRDEPKHHRFTSQLKAKPTSGSSKRSVSPELFRGPLTEFKTIKSTDRTMFSQFFEDPMGIDPPAVAGPQRHGTNKTMPL
jgi:hypothetical protein